MAPGKRAAPRIAANAAALGRKHRQAFLMQPRGALNWPCRRTPFPGETFFSGKLHDHHCATGGAHAIEKLREAELEEARSIQNVMLPMESLHAAR
jgi:hypothetical protein